MRDLGDLNNPEPPVVRRHRVFFDQGGIAEMDGEQALRFDASVPQSCQHYFCPLRRPHAPTFVAGMTRLAVASRVSRRARACTTTALVRWLSIQNFAAFSYGRRSEAP